MKRVIVFLTVLILAYLGGAFYSVSFNIAIWTEATRATTLFIGSFLALTISSCTFIDEFFK